MVLYFHELANKYEELDFTYITISDLNIEVQYIAQSSRGQCRNE